MKQPEKIIEHKVELVFKEYEHCGLAAGLRMNWADGDNEDSEVNMSSGAGCGSPYMTFTITDKKTRKTRYAIADIRPVIQQLAQMLK